MIKAISFDLDGVYFLKGKENFIFALRDLGVPESEAKRVFLQSDKMHKLYKMGYISDIAFWTWAIHEWKLRDKSVADMIDLLISGYQINQGAVEFIRRARKIGYRALVCTNNFPARIHGLNDKFSFLRDFDVVVASCDVHAIKPERKIYEELLKRSEVNADEILITDDSDDALVGAKELGMNTFVYSDLPSLITHLASIGVVA